MPKSEYILSDERLRKESEDAFFRRVMAKYCEDESKKLLSELEAEPKKPSLSVIDGMISKIRKKKNRRAAFSVLKRVTNGVAMLVLAAVIVFAGAVTASADVRSSLAEFTSRWSSYKDLTGKGFDLNGSDLENFSVNYAIGWNFDVPKYVKLRSNDSVFGGTVAKPSSKYFIGYSYNTSMPYAICNDNSYTIVYDSNVDHPIKGILSLDESGNAIFYPYYRDNNDNLFVVCERNESSENEFENNLYLSLPNKDKIKVQPFYIYLALSDRNGEGRSFLDFDELNPGSSHFFEAEIRFDIIFISAFAQNEDEQVSGTFAIGEFSDIEAINVIKKY